MPSAKHGAPIPDIPAKTTIPLFNVKTTKAKPPTTRIPTSRNFYYAGIQSLWLWYLVPLGTLRNYLDPLGMTPYDFGAVGKGKPRHGAVNVNFFNAAALYGTGSPGDKGIGGFNETELNIVGYASAVADKVPQGLSLQDYLISGDPTKRVGNYRVWVACDDAVAVACGIQVFMENKFLTPYTYDVPSVNHPKQGAKQQTWTWTCHDDTKAQPAIYSATVNMAGLSSVPANTSEIIDLSWDKASRRPVASRRNYFGMYATSLDENVAKAATIKVGTSKHPMRHDMATLVGRRRPVAIQEFTSPPCIAEAAGYFADL